MVSGHVLVQRVPSGRRTFIEQILNRMGPVLGAASRRLAAFERHRAGAGRRSDFFVVGSEEARRPPSACALRLSKLALSGQAEGYER
jgi:hypothetical protein